MFRRLARACAAASARCASSSSSSSSSTACFASTALPRASASRPRDAAPRASQKPAQLYVARGVSASPRIAHGADKKTKLTPENSIEVTFVERDGERRAVRGLIGENLLETAHRHDVELEGACEGSLACSTCHVVFEDEKVFETLPEACDDENDRLDLAYGLTATSRLGCQVTLERGALEGCVVILPRATRNFAVDGFVPKPH